MINSALVSGQDRKRLYWTNIPNVDQPKDREISLDDVIGKRSFSVVEQPFLRRKINGVYDRRYEPREDGKSGAVVSTRERQFNMVMTAADEKSANCSVVAGVFRGGGKQYPIKMPDGFYTVRSLTVEEREKLQTLPVGYTACATEAEAKKAIGNGWTVDVIAHIFTRLMDAERREQPRCLISECVFNYDGFCDTDPEITLGQCNYMRLKEQT
jgi:DNA (cytosine-5)-methyltransferase 3A